MGFRHQAQTVQGFIVQDAPVLYDAAMPMGRIFVDTDVRHDKQPRHMILERADGPLHDPVRIIPGRPSFILVIGDPEEHDRRNAQQVGVGRFLDQTIDGPPELVGHRQDGLLLIRPFPHEQRINQVARRERGFPHHPSQWLGFT